MPVKSIENWKAWVFVGSLVVIASCVNSLVYSRRGGSGESAEGRMENSSARFSPSLDHSQEHATAPVENSAARNAPLDQKSPQQIAAEQHAQYMAKYLNPCPPRENGTETYGVAVVATDGKFNPVLADAIARHCKKERIVLRSSLFTPQFVSDGLFNQAFDGSRLLFRDLELSNYLDGVLLAKQMVQTETTPSLNNLISAHVKLEMVAVPMAIQGETRSWTFKADGAGFKEAEARVNAEERLIQQIADSTNFSLGRGMPDRP